MRRLLLALALASLAMLPASGALAGWPNDPTINVPVCTSTGDQWYPAAVPDGSGGVVVAWYDWRGGSADVYAQRFNGAGVAQWTAGGVLVCGASGDQINVRVVSAGVYGTYVVWQDGRTTASGVYAQLVSLAGVAQWTANGILLADHDTNTVPQTAPAVSSDVSGALLAAWVQGSGTAADIYAQRVSRNGARGWTTLGFAVCTAAAAQGAPAVVSDGTSAGAIVAWQDLRSGAQDVYAQRIVGEGAAAWTANGVAVCTATGAQLAPLLAYDNAYGAVVSWTDLRSGDRDVYGQRLNEAGAALWTAGGVAVIATEGDQWNGGLVTDGQSGGVFFSYDWRNGNADVYAQRVDEDGAPVWTANGIVVCNAATDQVGTHVASDGDGGAFVTWKDSRAVVSADVYAQHVTRRGTLVWATNGVPVCRAMTDQEAPVVALDGSSGAYVAWMDPRNGNRDIYVQHVDRWGYLGAQPAIARPKDVPNDQGGRIAVTWNSSPYDSFPNNVVTEYRVYRRPPGSSTWTLVATQAAQCLSGYGAVCVTSVDSTAGSNPRTSFRVDAYSASVGATWASDVDSGYTVDNLPPGLPTSFVGTYAAGTATLAWDPSPVPDLAGYRLYRGASADFVPDAASLVAEPAGTGYADAAGAPCWYKLTAVDVHGNESPCATLLPSGTAGVPTGPPRALALSPPVPNPSRGATTLRLALPRATEVALVVYDQQGRAVRTLARGGLPAGEHPVAWDGRDDAGRVVASALYFIRLETEGRVFTRRLAVVR